MPLPPPDVPPIGNDNGIPNGPPMWGNPPFGGWPPSAGDGINWNDMPGGMFDWYAQNMGNYNPNGWPYNSQIASSDGGYPATGGGDFNQWYRDNYYGDTTDYGPPNPSGLEDTTGTSYDPNAQYPPPGGQQQGGFRMRYLNPATAIGGWLKDLIHRHNEQTRTHNNASSGSQSGGGETAAQQAFGNRNFYMAGGSIPGASNMPAGSSHFNYGTGRYESDNPSQGFARNFAPEQQIRDPFKFGQGAQGDEPRIVPTIDPILWQRRANADPNQARGRAWGQLITTAQGRAQAAAMTPQQRFSLFGGTPPVNPPISGLPNWLPWNGDPTITANPIQQWGGNLLGPPVSPPPWGGNLLGPPTQQPPQTDPFTSGTWANPYGP